MGREIRIGTRESLLAVAQAELLKRHLEACSTDIQVSLVKIKTTGDRILDRKLDEIGGKGLFVKELDLALYEGRTDLSVHSLKDMPMEEDPDYPILGYSRREVPQDALVLPKGCAGPEFDITRPVGTSSPRRSIQLAELYPGCQIRPVRGNVLTRLEKLDSGEYGALVLAAAGLLRLGLGSRISRMYSVTEIVPAAGQGILAVQGRKDFDRELLVGFFDEDARWQALAERGFLRAAGGGCSCAATAYAAVSGDMLSLTGLIGGTGDVPVRKGAMAAPKQDAARMGARLFASLSGGNFPRRK